MGGRPPQGGQGYGGGRPPGGGGRDFDRPSWRMPEIDKDAIRRAIAEDDPDVLVRVADQHGKDLAEARLATSQIRGIFGAARSMESQWSPRASDAEVRAGRRALLLLKPKLAYQEVRHRPQRPTDPNPVGLLRALLDPAIDSVGSDREKFRRFLEYFEALLAYHKAYGGADKASGR